MALFDRSELVLGKLLGKGAFCVVHELLDVRLNDGMVSSNFSRPLWWDNTILHEEDRTRESIQQTCREHTSIINNNEENPEDGQDPSIDDGDTAITPHKLCPPRYVVKQLRPNLATERGYKVFSHAAADLRMEYEILSQLSHPNIVRLRGGAVMPTLGSWSTAMRPIETNNDDYYFLVLERLDETLSRRIHCWKRLVLPQPPRQRCADSMSNPPFYLEKLRLARDMASALSHIHDQRLVFRDLKPDNCAISYDGTLKLIDFGLCRELPQVAVDDRWNGREPLFRMSGVGTRRYMAPETIVGRGYNQKIDCYSWAMVLYEMISLHKPFASYDRQMHKVLVCDNADRPHLSLDIPFPARDLLHRAWAQQPWDRPSMMEICNEVDIMIECVERQALTEHERSLKVIMEMSELFSISDQYPCTKKDDSFISRKSIAELTVSTSTTACSDPSICSPCALHEVTHSRGDIPL